MKFIDVNTLRQIVANGPSILSWEENEEFACTEVLISGCIVATLETRPHYCDRGHYSIKCYLPDIDGADSFPRYYMSKEVAKAETESFLKWRIWKIRGNADVKKE
jgi:hypothetical protein